ncbi:MAG TPA: dihydrolipoyl dehydrogenase [Dehalococcoidia bacterium]|nr:dihydrolipoyl dehydrogenase [Dehalococcoidales bacterium]HUX47649.1 dihydrolipoyl dehydrogenase [Dehalococcoidia bacterium]
MNQKDIVIIGGGSAGYVAAIHASHLGAKVALVEKDKLGGTCLNRGCIPTKALARSAEVLLETRRANDFGIEANNIRIDFPKIMARKNNIVSQLVSGVEQLMKANRISVYRGTGRILSPHLVKVNDEEIATGKLIIATGSESTPLPIPGRDLPGVLSTDEILELTELPESLVVIGGSYVGVEFASIFNALGTSVTIVKRRPLRLEPVDEEIGRRFAQTLPRLGVDVKIGAAVKAIDRKGGVLRVLWGSPEGEQGVDGQMVLMATGRAPYTRGLGLSELGIHMNGGAIKVNEYLETNIKDVYAIGDVLGKNMLAHVASYEGEIAVENALAHPRQADYRAVPNCIFARPEIAGVGMTEKEANDSGIPHKVSKFPFVACGRAVTMGETTGMVKMICHADDGIVLGLHIMGPHASDLIAEGVLAVRLGAAAEDIVHTIHAHPTLPEAVRETAMGQLDGAIHFLRV